MIQKELRELCKRLEDNDPTLTYLNLDYANIGLDGARALQEALKNNHVLTSIRLHHSNLGFEGTKILFEGLQHRGLRTTVNIVDDYTDSEYEQLFLMVKKPQDEKKSFGNGKGMDEEIFLKLSNDGRGHTVKNGKTNGKSDQNGAAHVAEGKSNG